MSVLGRFGAFRAAMTVELALHADGPILVRGPDAFIPDAPDMAFIRTPTTEGVVPFLPGSSLKGILRTGAEMLLRGRGEEACAPPEGCRNCRICKTFGSANLGAAVLLVGDGMPWPPGADREVRARAVAAVEASRTVRTGVAIDRQRGSVAAGPFDMEVLAGVTFYPTLTLRNPEPWQVGLTASALDLLDQGLLRIGSGTTKGLGRVRVEVLSVVVRCLDSAAAQPLLQGLEVRQLRLGLLWSVQCVNAGTALKVWSTLLDFSSGR